MQAVGHVAILPPVQKTTLFPEEAPKTDAFDGDWGRALEGVIKKIHPHILWYCE